MIQESTHSLLLGLSAEGWTAVATMMLAAVTLVLVVVGLVQIRSVRDENALSRTLSTCDRYDTDPVLDAAIRRIRAAKTGGHWPYPDCKVDVATILNYLDAIAIGIDQGLYIESLARDHMCNVLLSHVRVFLAEQEAVTIGIDRANYGKLVALSDRWSAGEIHYGAKRRRWW